MDEARADRRVLEGMEAVSSSSRASFFVALIAGTTE